MKKIFYIATISTVLFFCSHFNAQALTVSPARIEVSGVPNQILKKDITILNENKITSQTLYLSFENFESQGETGSPRFVESTSGISTWMTGPSSVTLAPSESKTITITINIPKDADSGGHFGVVFFGTAPNKEKVGQVSISAKTGVLVLLSVEGNINEAGGLLSFKTKDNKFFYTSLPVGFNYRFRNDGNDRVRPMGKIVIRNSVFYPTKTIDANPSLGNVLPNSTRQFETQWLKYIPLDTELLIQGGVSSFFRSVKYEWKNFAFGFYHARLGLSYGSKNNEAHDSLLFVVFPWHLVIMAIIIGIIIFIGGRWFVRRYNSYVIRNARSNIS